MEENRKKQLMEGIRQPYARKVQLAIAKILEFYTRMNGMVYVSISGGKDSMVMLHLINSVVVGLMKKEPIPIVFIDTGMERSSVKATALKYATIVLKPKMSYGEVCKKYGYPVISKEVAQKIENKSIEKTKGRGRYDQTKYAYLLDAPFKISGKCCDILKKDPARAYEKATGRMPFIGTTIFESSLRMSNWCRYGCNTFDMSDGRSIGRPLSLWSDSDILRYAKENDVELATCYGKIITKGLTKPICKNTGVKRTGCLTCMFGCRKARDFELKEKEIQKEYPNFAWRGTHKDIIDYIIKEGR